MNFIQKPANGPQFLLAILTMFFFTLTFPLAGLAQQDPEDDEKRVRRLRDSLAVDPNQEWVPGVSSSNRGREIERKMSLAEAALAVGNLIQPENDNALVYFNAVLAINPESEQARQGVSQIVTVLLSRAEAAVLAGNIPAVRQLLATINVIEPGNGRAAELENQMVRGERLDSLLQTAREHIAAHQLTGPGPENALASLNAALAIEPGNKEAVDALAEIRDLLIADAKTASDVDDFDQAYRILDQAANLPDSLAVVESARVEIGEAQQRHWRFMADDVKTIIEVGQLDLAEADIKTLAETEFDRDELAVLRTQLRDARILRDYPARRVFTDAFVDATGTGPRMIVIDKGQFTMGSPKSERGRKDKEGPQQQLQFERAFALAVTETSVAQFRQFVDATDYQTDVEQDGSSTAYDVTDGSLKKVNDISWRRDYENQPAGDQLPVIHVSWNDAMAYVEWLSEATGEQYRLVSESEFEFSLRAGSDTRYWWGNSSPREQVENLTGERDSNSGPWQWPKSFRRYDDGHWGPAPVASYLSNGNGVHDLGGNVLEWVADCYHSTLLGIPADGTARTDGNCNLHTIRGASWASQPDLARSAYRSSAQSSRSASIIGFRVARDL